MNDNILDLCGRNESRSSGGKVSRGGGRSLDAEASNNEK